MEDRSKLTKVICSDCYSIKRGRQRKMLRHHIEWYYGKQYKVFVLFLFKRRIFLLRKELKC